MAANASFLELIAILGASALAIFIVALAIMSGMQAVADKSPALLSQMLRSQGLDPEQPMFSADGREFGIAVRRCTRCTGRQRCREWLASGAREGYQAFCPNAAFIASARR
jgi:hypothetical protein